MTRRVTALIAAAGSGQRLGADRPKAFVTLGGRTLIERAVAAMAAVPTVDRTIVLVQPAWRDAAAELLSGSDVQLVDGGPERFDSIWQGLQAIPDADGAVLIHDAARALTPPGLIARVIQRVLDGAPAVIPVVPVADTIKRVDDAGRVLDTPPRAMLRAVQTPQGFDLRTLRAANEAYFAHPDFAITDDASLMEWRGVPVVTVPGDPLAFKITTPLDYRLAQTEVAHD